MGVGIVVALLASLLLAVVPVSAVSVPVVTLTAGPVGPPTNPAGVISKANVYEILFTTGSKILGGEQIVVTFPAGTNITTMVAANVYIESTAGLGGVPFGVLTPVAVAVVGGTYPAAQTLTITPHAANIIGAGALVQLTIGSAAAICPINPATPASYNLTVATQTAVPVVK